MHSELQAEQDYIDNAYACLDRMREVVARAGDAGVGEIAALALDAWKRAAAAHLRGRGAGALLRPADA